MLHVTVKCIMLPWNVQFCPHLLRIASTYPEQRLRSWRSQMRSSSWANSRCGRPRFFGGGGGSAGGEQQRRECKRGKPTLLKRSKNYVGLIATPVKLEQPVCQGPLQTRSRNKLPAWRLTNFTTKITPPRRPATKPKAAKEMCAHSGSLQQLAMAKRVEVTCDLYSCIKSSNHYL